MTMRQAFQEILDKKNKSITILQGFNRVDAIIHVKCNKCNKILKMEAYRVLYSDHICKEKASLEDLMQMIEDAGYDITLLGRFVSGSSSTEVMCNKCGKRWHIPLRRLLKSGHKCK